MYSCLPFVDDSVIVKGNFPEYAALYYEDASTKCSVEKKA